MVEVCLKHTFGRLKQLTYTWQDIMQFPWLFLLQIVRSWHVKQHAPHILQSIFTVSAGRVAPIHAPSPQGGFCQSGNPQWEVSLSSTPTGSRPFAHLLTRLPLSLKECVCVCVWNLHQLTDVKKTLLSIHYWEENGPIKNCNEVVRWWCPIYLVNVSLLFSAILRVYIISCFHEGGISPFLREFWNGFSLGWFYFSDIHNKTFFHSCVTVGGLRDKKNPLHLFLI